MFILFYADDTVILAESANDLQFALNEFYRYCDTWKLTVNISKTKIVVFSKGRQPKYAFTYNGLPIEIVKEFNYLGVIFSRTGSFFKAKKRLCEQAQKSMYGVIRKIRTFNLPIDCQLDLFDKVVVPVLLYACEVWGYENIEIIERVHLKFLKHILNLKSCTPSYMVYGETGRFPLYITIFTRMISFWANIINSSENKLSKITYMYVRILFDKGQILNPWLCSLKNILDKCGLSNVWCDHESYHYNSSWIKTTINQRLRDQFLQKWHNDIQESTKGVIYRIFKTNFECERYLLLLPCKLRKILVKFRTTNHHLPVEIGRWGTVERSKRYCNLCNCNKIGDEFHVILECKALSKLRSQFLDTYLLFFS